MDLADPGIPGPKFSDDIQLVASVENFENYTRGTYATSVFGFGQSGKNVAIDVHILAPGGAILFSVEQLQGSAAQLMVVGLFDDPQPFLDPGEARNWGFQAGPDALSAINFGYITAGSAPGVLFRVDRGFLQGTPGAYMSFDKHLRLTWNQTTSSLMSWVMVELHRQHNQPLVDYG